jgi:hypothetical protein
LRKIFGPGAIRGFVVFAGVFEGVLEKVGAWVWCFCGQVVVECVANVENRWRDFDCEICGNNSIIIFGWTSSRWSLENI